MSHQISRFLFLHPNMDLFLDRMENSFKKGMNFLIRSLCLGALSFGFYYLFFQFPGDIFRMINLLVK